MSGRTSNLSWNLVDWDRHRRLLELMGGAPAELGRYLAGLELAPADHERRIEQTAAGRPADWLDIVPRLRCDPARYAAEAAALIHRPDPFGGRARSELLQLAFVHQGSRWYGDLWLTSPTTVLAWFSPRFREHDLAWVRRDGQLRQQLEALAPDAAGALLAPPAEVPAGVAAVELAMGGLGDDAEPLDAIQDPATVRALARDLAAVRVTPLPGDDRLFRALLRFYRGDDDDDQRPADPLERDIAWELEQLRTVYARAAAGGHGMDVRWHPNP